MSQQVLFLIKEYLNRSHRLRNSKSPAQVLLELSGSWIDDRGAEEIIVDIKRARKNSNKLEKGF